MVKRSVRVAGLLGPAVLLAATLGGCGGARRETAADTTANDKDAPLLLLRFSVTTGA